jgi:hypothetical protein
MTAIGTEETNVVQTIRYEVTVKVPDEPLLDETDSLRLERALAAAVPASWGVETRVERI